MLSDYQKLMLAGILSFLGASILLIFAWLLSVRDFIKEFNQKQKDDEKYEELQKQMAEREDEILDRKLDMFEGHKAEQEDANKRIFKDIADLHKCLSDFKKDVEHKFQLLEISQDKAVTRIIDTVSNRINELKKEI